MKPLDLAADWTIRILSPLPDKPRQMLWFPLLVILVLVVARFIVRRLAVTIANVVAWLVRTGGILIGVAMLVPEAVTAAALRRFGARPPAVVYGYGDAVAASVVSVEAFSHRLVPVITRLSKINFAVVLIAVGAWFWAWDHGQCESVPDRPACVSPVRQWYQQAIG